jgi:hypothetical protein
MDLYEQSHRLYSRLRLTWFILLGATAIAFFSDHLGVPIASPVVELVGLGLAAPGVFSWYNKSKALLSLSSELEKEVAHRAIWNSHKTFGTICAVGSGVMIPGGFMLLQVPFTGWIILSSIHLGTIFFILGHRLEAKFATVTPTADVTFEKNTKAPKSKSSSKKVTLLVLSGLAIPIFFAIITVTPLFNFDFQAKSSLSGVIIKSLHENTPQGFEVSAINGSSYGIDNVSADSSFSMTKPLAEPNFAEECKQLLAWGTGVGVKSWTFDPVYVPTLLEGKETQAQIACVYTLSGAELVTNQPDAGGSSMFVLQGSHESEGKSAPIRLEVSASSDPSKKTPYTINVGVSTDVSSSASVTGVNEGQSWDASYLAYQNLLNALGGYRAGTGNNDYFTAKTFAVATKQITDLELTPAPSKDGLIHLVSASNKDKNAMMLPLCVNIDPWDEKFAGLPDPVSGYVLGFLQNPEHLNKFGRAVTGPCPSN